MKIWCNYHNREVHFAEYCKYCARAYNKDDNLNLLQCMKTHLLINDKPIPQDLNSLNKIFPYLEQQFEHN